MYLKATLNDFDDRGFDLIRRHASVTQGLSDDEVSISLSDSRQQMWRDSDVATHNDAVARAEIFFAQANAGIQLDVRAV